MIFRFFLIIFVAQVFFVDVGYCITFNVGDDIKVKDHSGKVVIAKIVSIDHANAHVSLNDSTNDEKNHNIVAVSITALNELNPDGPLPPRLRSLWFKSIANDITTIDIDENELSKLKVIDLKKKLQDKINIHYSGMQLNLYGNMLYDEDTLEKVGIKGENTIYLIVRGGGRPYDYSGHRPAHGEVRTIVIFAENGHFVSFNLNPAETRVNDLKTLIGNRTHINMDGYDIVPEDSQTALNGTDLLSKCVLYSQPIFFVKKKNLALEHQNHESKMAIEAIQCHLQEMTTDVGESLKKMGIDDIKCAICLDEFKMGQEVVKPNCACKVGYCGPCINNWMTLKNFCPMCSKAIDGFSVKPLAPVSE